jgi:hypothetical protein
VRKVSTAGTPAGSSDGSSGRLRDRVLALAHDMRNPLGVITLTLERLLAASESDELLRRLGRKPLDAIRRSADSMEQLLDALADAAHAHSPGNAQTEPQADASASSAGPAQRLDAPAMTQSTPSTPSTVLTPEGLQTIGLAFVHELVRLHGGDVRVSNDPGQPTQFMIAIPPRSSPSQKVPSLDQAARVSASGATAAIEQALRWLPNEELRQALEAAIPTRDVERASVPPSHEALRVGPSEARILLAEDNAELRA